MKLIRSILLLLPLFLLSSCSDGSPIKPIGPSTGSNTSPISPDTEYVRALSLDEIVETFASAELALKSIKGKTITHYALEGVYDFKDDTSDTTSYLLTETSLLYNNSIIFTSYNASQPDKNDEYIRFGFYDFDNDPSYGALVEEYITFSDDNTSINTIDVYKEAGKSNRKNITLSEPSTLALSESKFNMFDEGLKFIDPVEEQNNIIIFAVDIDGFYDIVYFTEDEILAGDDLYSIKETRTYRFLDGIIYYENMTYELYSTNDVDQTGAGLVESISVEFSYSSNGDFDRNNLPKDN